MSGTVQDAILRLIVDSSQAKKGADDFKNQTNNIKQGAKEASEASKGVASSFKDIVKEAVGLASVGISFGKIVEEARKAESAQYKLQMALKAQGSSAVVTAGELNKMAEALSKVSRFGDDDLVNVGKSFASMGNTSTDLVKKLLPLTAAMTVMNSRFADVGDAAFAMKKAFEAPSEGLALLERNGVKVSASTRVLIKNLVDSGNSTKFAHAQMLLYNELLKKVGNPMEVLAGDLDTLDGAMTHAAESANDLAEKIGTQPVVLNTLKGFYDALSKALGFLAENADVVAGTLAVMATIAAGPALKLLVSLAAAALGPWGLLAAAIGAAVIVFRNLAANIPEVGAAFDKVKAFLNDSVATFKTWASGAGDATTQFIADFLDGMDTMIVNLTSKFETALETVAHFYLKAKEYVTTFKDFITGQATMAQVVDRLDAVDSAHAQNMQNIASKKSSALEQIANRGTKSVVDQAYSDLWNSVKSYGSAALTNPTEESSSDVLGNRTKTSSIVAYSAEDISAARQKLLELKSSLELVSKAQLQYEQSVKDLKDITKVYNISQTERSQIEAALQQQLKEGLALEKMELEQRQRARDEIFRSVDSIRQEAEAMRAGQEAYDRFVTSQEEEKNLLDLTLRLREQNIRLHRDEMDGVDALTKAYKKNVVERKEAKKILEQDIALHDALKSAYENAASGIQSAFSDAFESVFNGGVNTFKSFASTVKQIFVRMAAQIAALLVFQPVLGGITSLFGLGSSGTSTGSSGSGTSASSGTSLLGTLGNLGSLGNSLFGGSSLLGGVSGAIDSFGASYLGLANVNSSFVGPLMAGQTAGTTLSGLLGGVGVGFGAGTLLNSLLGGNSTNGMIGSGAGAATGAAIGSIIPGVGTVIGGLVGGLFGGGIGGLFGGKPSDKTQAGTLNLSDMSVTTSGLSGKKFSQENADYRDALFDAAKSMAQLIQSTGATTSGSLSVAIGSRDGLRVNGVNYGYNNEAVLKAVLDTVVNSSKDLSDTFKTIVNTVGYSDLDALSEAFTFGKYYDNLVKDVEDTVDLAKELNDTFDSLITQVSDLGLSAQAFTTAYAREFNEQMDQNILAITDPYQLAIEQFEKEAQARLDFAEKIGADVNKVEEYNGLLRKQIVEQYGKDTTDALKQQATDLKTWLDNQVYSSTSSASPYEQFTSAQSAFKDAIASAKSLGADADMSSVTSAASNLLGLGKTVYGGATTDYSVLEQLTLSMVKSLGKELGLPGFAMGGEFVVGGNGGVDSQTVAFRATPGERVRVDQPNRASDLTGFKMMTQALQSEMGELHKEMSLINKNLSRNRQTDLLVRKNA